MIVIFMWIILQTNILQEDKKTIDNTKIDAQEESLKQLFKSSVLRRNIICIILNMWVLV